MAVKIILQRYIPENAQEEVFPLFMKLRAIAMGQEGYISGETLRNFEDSKDYLVISTWRSVEDWKAWEASAARNQIQSGIDSILEKKTQYKIYQYI